MGTLTVWADPADGKVYLVNGHHRLEKAVEAGEKTVPVVRFLSPEVKTADEAAKLGRWKICRRVTPNRSTPHCSCESLTTRSTWHSKNSPVRPTPQPPS